MNLRALLCLRGETGRLAAAASLFESQIGGGIDHRKTCHKSHEFFLLQSNLKVVHEELIVTTYKIARFRNSAWSKVTND